MATAFAVAEPLLLDVGRPLQLGPETIGSPERRTARGGEWMAASGVPIVRPVIVALNGNEYA